MRFTGKSAIGILVVMGSVFGWGDGPDRNGSSSGALAAAASAVNAGGTSEDGEIWVTAQNTDELKIIHGVGGVDSVALPSGARPHTISFSPDGSYAYVSNIGDGDLIVVPSR